MTDFDSANRFLEENYLRDHNQRFARPVASKEDFHRNRPGKRELDATFQLEQKGALSLDWLVSYNGKLLQLE